MSMMASRSSKPGSHKIQNQQQVILRKVVKTKRKASLGDVLQTMPWTLENMPLAAGLASSPYPPSPSSLILTITWESLTDKTFQWNNTLKGLEFYHQLKERAENRLAYDYTMTFELWPYSYFLSSTKNHRGREAPVTQIQSPLFLL